MCCLFHGTGIEQITPTIETRKIIRMGDNAARASEQAKAAEKKLTSWSIFGNKHEEASELFEKAANNYKLAKLWDEAGGTHNKIQ
jgi:alpha-soluble NSF attachment protein